MAHTKGDSVTVNAGRRPKLAWAQGYTGTVTNRQRGSGSFRVRVVDSQGRRRSLRAKDADVTP